MSVIKRPVECIAKCDGKGDLRPIRIRFEDDQGTHVINIAKIIEQEIKNGFGTMNGNSVKIYSFKYESVIDGRVIPYKLTFETKGCTWNMCY